MSEARAEILHRVRAALDGAAAPPPAPRAYRRAGSLDRERRTRLFCERVGEYRAEVRSVPAADVAAAVAEVLRARRAGRVGVPAGLPASWRPDGVGLVEDTGLGARELDALDGVVTGCTAAVAETGTIVLAGGARDGRRALTLVPDLHVCVVEEEQIVEVVPELTERLGTLERRPITLVSGPSATSDIELSRVEGVHGPRDLVVIVATGAAGTTGV